MPGPVGLASSQLSKDDINRLSFPFMIKRGPPFLSELL